MSKKLSLLLIYHLLLCLEVFSVTPNEVLTEIRKNLSNLKDSPIGAIDYKDKHFVFHSETEVGPIIKKLYDTLYGIQLGEVKAPEGWIYKVEL